jgi:hypothetical protein
MSGSGDAGTSIVQEVFAFVKGKVSKGRGTFHKRPPVHVRFQLDFHRILGWVI